MHPATLARVARLSVLALATIVSAGSAEPRPGPVVDRPPTVGSQAVGSFETPEPERCSPGTRAEGRVPGIQRLGIPLTLPDTAPIESRLSTFDCTIPADSPERPRGSASPSARDPRISTRSARLESLFAAPQPDGPARLATAADIATLRQIVVLRVSPDQRRYALLVREPDPAANTYVSAWFIGESSGGAPRWVGDAGEMSLAVLGNGVVTGDLAKPEARWSPDGEWLVYPVKRQGEVQLWMARADGSATSQLTRNSADPIEFEWSPDGTRVLFNVASPRAERVRRQRELERNGYNYDEDLMTYYDLMSPMLREVPEKPKALWAVAADGTGERPATVLEQEQFAAAKKERSSGSAGAIRAPGEDSVTLRNPTGGEAWLEAIGEYPVEFRVRASLAPDRAEPKTCPGELGSGLIDRFWWSDDGTRVRFIRLDLANAPGVRIMEWEPGTGQVAELFHFPDQFLRDCSPVADDRLIAVRESLSMPVHVVLLDMRTRQESVVADPNPEFRRIRLGRVVRLEWDTPVFAWNEPGGVLEGTYPKRAVGYLILPPDFDPAKRYPAFIEPYALFGFNSSVGQEHPLQAYAAAGIVVLNFSFPAPVGALKRIGPKAAGLLYSYELGFPHISMRMESTVNGLRAAEARGFVDPSRVGIGGVSNGTFVPLRMMQVHDLIAAASISGGGWGPEEYYFPTKKGLEHLNGPNWRPKPVGKGAEYWRELDMAEHVDTLEAPILMHHSLNETHTAVRLMRHMADANLPYDAYVYTGELHVKWQPAHRLAIMNRNLDWFRFWLQGYEDPDPKKADQYRRWEKLRTMHAASKRAHD